MTEVARITKHPEDQACVLLHTPPNYNDRFGGFGPARYTPEHRAYVIHHTHIDALYRWAKRIDLHVIDERRAGKGGIVTRPVECAACTQPGSKSNPPAMCPSCGVPWRPVPPPERHDPLVRTACPACSHKQPGKFPYCARCGAEMAYPDKPVKRPPLPRPERKREHLDDPLPLSQVIAEEAPALPAGTIGRPVEDVDLPDDDVEQQSTGEEYDPTTEPEWEARHQDDDEPQVEDPPEPWGWGTE